MCECGVDTQRRSVSPPVDVNLSTKMTKPVCVSIGVIVRIGLIGVSVSVRVCVNVRMSAVVNLRMSVSVSVSVCVSVRASVWL